MASSLRRLLKLNAEHDVLVDISDAENVSKIVERQPQLASGASSPGKK